MRPVRAVGLYLVLVFLGGALVAPWVYHLVQSVSGILPGLQGVASKPFPRYVNRCLLILALAGLWPFLRAAGLSAWRQIGLPRRPDALAQVMWGLLLGLVSLACVVIVALATGARELALDQRPLGILAHCLKAALTGLIVATIEEIVFRGALFGALRKTFHWTFALVVSSAIYALLHFLERAEPVARVDWDSGLVVLLAMVRGFGNVEKLLPGFLNLTLAGMILGLAYQRSSSLYLSIGLHAGWIFWLKTYGFATDQAASARSWFFGTSKLIDGWLAFLVLGMMFVLAVRYLAEEQRPTGWKEPKLFI